MKFLSLALLFVASTAFAQIDVLQTTCKNQDCFKYGWVTTASGYLLNTNCKGNDCTKNGWFSVANKGSTFDVTCRNSGCFTNGWDSVQYLNGRYFYDDATCKGANCLKYGWNVVSSYDPYGRDVSCNNNDCSKNGGTSYWRGHSSRTVCYANDCYKNGWTVYIY